MSDSVDMGGETMWDLIGALIPALAGLFFAIQSWKMGLGDLTSPGPGLFPFYISLAITLLSGGLTVGQLFRPDGRQIKLKALRRPLLGLLSTMVYALLLGTLGYLLTTTLLVVFWVRILGERSWKASILVALPAAAISYTVFDIWLGVPLPSGLLV